MADLRFWTSAKAKIRSLVLAIVGIVCEFGIVDRIDCLLVGMKYERV